MEMMQTFLNTEEENYASNLTEENLKKKMEYLFDHGTFGLVGKLTGEKRFIAYDKWVVVGWDVPNLKRKAAYLKGKFQKYENGTLVNLKVKPNSILPVFAILAIILGGMFSYLAFSNTGIDTLLLTFGFVFIALGIIYYPISTFLRNRLRNKVVKYLDLNKV